MDGIEVDWATQPNAQVETGAQAQAVVLAEAAS